MEIERFAQFTIHVDRLSKYVKQIKAMFTKRLGVKSVHIFWLYALLSAPEGLTPAEIAERCNVDPSLISRELAELERNEIICTSSVEPGKRKYNKRYHLTERGTEIASSIRSVALQVQSEADTGLSDEELRVFYCTIEKLCHNFANLSYFQKQEKLQ